MSRPGSNGTTARAIPHRLPTVSAASALRKSLGLDSSVATGCEQVDGLLAGGLARGKVAEVHGPPGSGKTTFAISASVKALKNAGHVAWLDCGYHVSACRVEQILRTSGSTSDPQVGMTDASKTIDSSHFHHYEIPALANLVALLRYPPGDFPPTGTRLLVLDSVSTLFISAFPSNYHPPSNSNAKETPQQWAASRRWSLQRDVISMLNKLAAVHDMAILATCQMATRFDWEQTGTGKPKAMLRPSLNTKSWTDGLHARILLFRHWGPRQTRTRTQADGVQSINLQGAQTRCLNRYAGLVKLGNVEYEICGRFVPFEIGEMGLQNTSHANTLQPLTSNAPNTFTSPARSQSIETAKRHVEQIADSESDEEARDLGEVQDADDGVAELNEMGLTKEEQDLLDLELDRNAR